MAGAHRVTQFGPQTYAVSAAVTGGQLVEPTDTTALTVKPATANSVKVLGVAMSDANTAASNPTDPLNVSWPQPEVAVAYGPGEFTLTFTAACNFGDLVVAGAAGAVTKLADVTTPTAGDVTGTRAVVGRCTEPGGVAAAGPGKVRLYI